MNRIKPPKVSIITPSYNNAKFIKQTIESVLSQNYQPLEYIIIDGGSKDGTLEILYQYKNRIKWISESDNGMTEAINKGFRMATGDIVGWINSDDLYAAQTLNMSVEHLLSNPKNAAVYSDGELIDHKGNYIKKLTAREFSLKELLLGNYYICQPTLLFRRKVLEKIGWLDEQFPHFTMDLDLLLRLGLNYKIGYIDSLGASFRIHESSKSISQNFEFHSERISTLKKFFNKKALPDEYKDLEGKSFAYAYLNGACQFYECGQINNAKINLMAANSKCPEVVNNPDNLLPAVIGSLPYGKDPFPMVKRFFEHLPPELDYLNKYKDQATNLAAVASAFQAHDFGDQRLVRKRLFHAVLAKPSWLSNRGVLSIGAEAMIGTPYYKNFKKMISPVNQN